MAEPPSRLLCLGFSAPECYRQSKVNRRCPQHEWSDPAGELPTTHGGGSADLLTKLLIAYVETLAITARGED